MTASQLSLTSTAIGQTSSNGRSWKDSGKTSVVEYGYENGQTIPNPLSRLWSHWVAGAKQQNDGNWKPLSLTTPILLATLLTTLLIVATIELLAQRSQALGGFALSNSLDDIPQYAMIAYQYAPQVVAVLYSLIWSWIDLDVKRMQPWFELAKPGGSSAADSLMLEYPFTFMAWVPFQAARRKHWMVFLSGTTMMIVFWAITPLQASHLSADKVQLTESREISTRSRLMPLADQLDVLGPELINHAYAVAWLNQSYPPFTTPYEAFFPFYVDSVDEGNLPAESQLNWTATTTQLSTELSCWPADISQHEGAPQYTFDFLNGQGCNASLPMSAARDYSMSYLGYLDSPYSGNALGSPGCPPTENSTRQFLAIWNSNIVDINGTVVERNLTAAFCQAEYFKQEVMVTVHVGGLKPNRDSIQPIGSRERLLDSEFNRTAYEFVLINGMAEEMARRDYPFNFVLDQYPKVAGRNLSTPLTNMVGFALASQDWHAREYSQVETLHQIYDEAHKYLFALTVNQLLTNHTDFADRTATSTFTMWGIVVSRVISAVLEALLLLVAIFTGIIMWMVSKVSSNLDANPSSISRIAKIFGNSPQLLDSLCTVDNADEKSLLTSTNNDKFQIAWSSDRHYNEATRHKGPVVEKDNQLDVPRGYYDPVRPAALRTWAGVVFVLAVVGTMTGLAYLKWAELKYTGLQRPSPNNDVQQILESYIPTMLSTMIEPFWILVNRLLCVLQPFKDLWAGKAKPGNSISATYSSVPPQFVALRALKARHFILAMVCGAVFLANILTVSLPAIFDDKDTLARYSQDFQSPMATTFQNETISTFYQDASNSGRSTAKYYDHAFTVMANITEGASLLPWVSRDFFFQPWDAVSSPQGRSADSYSILTRGYGAKMNCTTVEPADLPFEPKVYTPVESVVSTCPDNLDLARTAMLENTSDRDRGIAAMEHSGTTTAGRNNQCDQTLTFGWGRSRKSEDVNATARGSFAMCQPVFQTAMFQVEVDTSGYVITYDRVGEMETQLDYEDSDGHIQQLLADSNLMMSGDGRWHNSTMSADWMSHLIVKMNDSRTLLDPLAPVPDPKEIVPFIVDIYGRMFATLLGLNHQLFEKATSGQIITGTRIVRETRLFMDQSAFIISMTLLGVNIGIAAILYTRAVVFVLPRMPTTLGSILAYIAPSRFVAELDEAALNDGDMTFSFGRFIGRDGDSHIGVEMDPHVVPIDPASLGKPARRRYGFFGRRDPREPRDPSWL